MADMTQSRMPVAPGVADAVVMTFSLSALPAKDHKSALDNCHRMLKPGALLLFRDYGLYDLKMLRSAPRNHIEGRLYRRNDNSLAYYFSVEYTRELFASAGFRELSLKYCTVRGRNRKKGITMDRVWINAEFVKTESRKETGP